MLAHGFQSLQRPFISTAAQQQTEFVATDACKQLVFLKLAAQRAGQHTDQFVASGVAGDVVDHLELVHVNVGEGHLRVSSRGSKLVSHHLSKRGAIGQPGQ